jgi:hypothetical protein
MTCDDVKARWEFIPFHLLTENKALPNAGPIDIPDPMKISSTLWVYTKRKDGMTINSIIY